MVGGLQILDAIDVKNAFLIEQRRCTPLNDPRVCTDQHTRQQWKARYNRVIHSLYLVIYPGAG